MSRTKNLAKILIFGKHGQVGSQLVAQLKDRSDLQIISTDIEDVDLTDNDATRQLVMDHRPAWVINTSAHTAVDRAEQEQELAYQLNAVAPGVIASACAKINAAMVHYSTDYVFNGLATSPYEETDTPDPQSVYGNTKLRGEKAVSAALDTHLIFRTAWVYSKDGKNFVNTMLQLAQSKDSLNVVCDQFGSPTLAEHLAAATISVIDQLRADPDEKAWGIYHATGSGATNWAEFAATIMALSGNQHIEINPIPGSQYPTPAPRPAYSVLSNEKLKCRFAVELPQWRRALEHCLG